MTSAGDRSPHLYVMQAASGLIKIGRSHDPKARRRSVEAASGCAVRLVKVFADRGHAERAIHANLSAWRRRGEWFAGTEACQQAICNVLGEEVVFPWNSKGNPSQRILQAERNIWDELLALPPQR